jgi:hypothetical protein
MTDEELRALEVTDELMRGTQKSTMEDVSHLLDFIFSGASKQGRSWKAEMAMRWLERDS